MVQLKTERLFIRPYTHHDLEHRRRLSRECFGADNDAAVVQSWLDWTMLSHRWFAALAQPPYGDYAVALHDETVIGSVGLVPSLVPWGVLRDVQSPADARVSPEFGLYWAIVPHYQRSGYATEAARAMIAYIFDTLYARQVVATTEFDNAASIAVMRALGMEILRNRTGKPFWCEIVGVLENR